MAVELEEFEPGRWRVKKARHEKRRAENLPLPFVISDTMDPVEQVDGRFYTSKRAFRAVGRALGLTEVGNEKPTPRARPSAKKESAEKRRSAIKQAIQRVKAGERTHSP
jgi:hypothetical protein